MSNIYKTLRQYLTESEADSILEITEPILKLAEELIDIYVAYVEKHVNSISRGIATGGSKTTLIDTSGDSPLSLNSGYFERCVLQIIGGTNKGEVRFISGYDKDQQKITLSEQFTNSIDTTSVYKIYQLARFPRNCDVEVITNNGDSVYYKDIPEKVRRAVIFQCEYIIEQGDSFFSSGSDIVSETIDDYSYKVSDSISKSSIERLISPKARTILATGIRKKVGRFSDIPNTPR